jgi:hypothetical protein
VTLYLEGHKLFVSVKLVALFLNESDVFFWQSLDTPLIFIDDVKFFLDQYLFFDLHLLNFTLC